MLTVSRIVFPVQPPGSHTQPHEGALFRHEHEERTRESTIRRLAIVDLGRRGVVATEAEIVKWKAEHFKQADTNQ
jgi:hypothetical protein